MENLKKFIDKKTNANEWSKDIFIIKDRAYATESHILVRKKLQENAPESEQPNESVKSNILSMFAGVKYNNVLKASESLKILSRYKTEPIYRTYEKRCKACNNSGYVEFEFCYDGKTYFEDCECPVCMGNCGTITDWNNIIDYGYNFNTLVKIEGKLFKAEFIDLILSTFSDVEIAVIKQMLYFKSDEYEGFLMENLGSDECVIIELKYGS